MLNFETFTRVEVSFPTGFTPPHKLPEGCKSGSRTIKGDMIDRVGLTFGNSDGAGIEFYGTAADMMILSRMLAAAAMLKPGSLARMVPDVGQLDEDGEPLPVPITPALAPVQSMAQAEGD